MKALSSGEGRSGRQVHLPRSPRRVVGMIRENTVRAAIADKLFPGGFGFVSLMRMSLADWLMGSGCSRLFNVRLVPGSGVFQRFFFIFDHHAHRSRLDWIAQSFGSSSSAFS